MVDDEGEDSSGEQKELKPEGVVVMVVGCLELGVHEIDCAEGGC